MLIQHMIQIVAQFISSLTNGFYEPISKRVVNMETMKKGVKVGTVIYMTWINCMRGFWWCHNTDIFIYLICGKGVQTYSVKCTVCIKWINKRCSGLRDDMSLLADGLKCKRCDGTIQEADLVVDGEAYGCVKSFSYLGDTFDGDGRCPLCQK